MTKGYREEGRDSGPAESMRIGSRERIRREDALERPSLGEDPSPALVHAALEAHPGEGVHLPIRRPRWTAAT